MGKACVSDGTCSYDEHAPRSHEGWQAWDVLQRGQLQLRAGPSGPFALDLPALLQIGAASGYDVAALVELLPAGEAGMAAAMAERADHGDG